MTKKIYILFFTLLLFGITQAQVIQLRKPVKGDVWPAFTVQRIEWTSTNIDNIKIEFSSNGGQSWSTIIASYPASAEYYDWEVPNTVSSNCFIRVSDVANPTTYGSNYPSNPFIIPAPGITIDAIPSIVYGKSVLPIPWTHSGIKRVNVYLSYSGKSDFKKIADTVSANNGFYIWIVKDTVAVNCYLRVEDASNPTLSDTSDQAFSIQPLPQSSATKFKGGKYDGHASASTLSRLLKVVSPNLKDSLVGSTVYTIKWESRNIDQIKLEFTTDNGNSWNTIQPSIPASAGRYDWKVPNTPTSSGRIRITDISDITFMDSSDSLFTIRRKELKLTSPDATSKLYKGSVWPISWSAMGVTKVRLKYLPSGIIADTVSATNEMYNWVATSVPDSFRVVIQDLEDSLVSDTSVYLKSYSLPQMSQSKYRGGKYDGHSSSSNLQSRILITVPNKKLSISAGGSITLQWKSTNVDMISVWISLDSLKTWSMREASISASTGTYTLRLPNATASYCFVRLESVADNSVYDITDSSFSLIPKQLKNTTDSTNWVVGRTKMLSWESVGIDSLSVSYKSSLNGPWIILNKSYAANTEVFYWVVPKSFDSLWIKLSDVYDTALTVVNTYHKRINEISDASSVVKYKGGKFDGHSFRSNINKIIIRKPDANEVVVSGTKYSINWSTINVTDSVMMHFSIDSGKTWIQIGKVSAVNGLYAWTVPVTLGGTMPASNSGSSAIDAGEINSTNCLLRAVDPANANEVVGISPKTFTIKSSSSKVSNQLTFSKPSDMVWPGGEKQKLQASSTSGKNIKYFILSGSAATVSKDTLIAVKAGKVSVGAVSEGDENYFSSDTVKYTICVNPAKPVITVKDSKTSFCAGDSALLSGPVGFSYKWSGGDTVQTVSIKSSKNLSLQVMVEGCSSVFSDTVKLISDTIPKPVSADTAVCLGNVATLRATALAGNTLKWYGTSATGGTASTTAPNPVSTAVGATNFYVSQVNSKGCESDRSKIIFTVNPLPVKPTITFTDTILSVPSGYASYQWIYNNGLISGATSNTLRPSNSGNYRVIVKNASGCSDTSGVYTLSVTAVTVPVLEGKIVKLYPNPTAYSAILDLGQTPRQAVQLKLMTLNGMVIHSWSVKEQRNEIILSSLPAGEYLIEVISGRNRTILRVVKVN